MNLKLLIPAVLMASSFAGSVSAADVSYSRDVRPILAANCLACHGQDASKREADLRLDVREVATAPAKAGLIAIVAGKPDESELIRRITSSDPEIRMPHIKSKKPPLTADQIAKLQQWITQGAEEVRITLGFHRAPVRTAVPERQRSEIGPHNPIDQFVLNRLEREGLKPSPETDKITLRSRLSFGPYRIAADDC